MIPFLVSLALQTANPPVTPPPSNPPTTTTPAVAFNAKKAAQRTFAMIRKEAFHEPSGFYGEEWELGKMPTGTCFNWSMGVMFSGVNALAHVDDSYRPAILDTARAVRAYWNEAGPVAGFDVLPGFKPVDRYYDDNMWLCLDLCDAFDETRKVDLLLEARATFDYILSGETKELGGGILWRESDKASKNSCSNAPAAMCAIELYRRTKDKKYLDAAVRIYKWADANLRDPEDGLMWDSIGIKEGKIDKTKWTYNTALMLKAEHALLELKAIPDLSRAKLDADADAAVKRWVLPSGGFRDESKFAHMLFEALLQIGAKGYTKTDAKRTLVFLETQNRDRAGHFPHRWDTVAQAPVQKPALIDQASALRAFAIGARYGL